MKVLHINSSDISGGAGIAGHRLHEALPTQGIKSMLLVDKMQSDSNLSAAIPRRRYLSSLGSRLAYHTGLNYVNHISSFNIPSHPFYKEADILNFHDLHGDYFNYLALPKLTEQKPAVFTLHDMWGFTGHCAYSFECDRWKIGCGNCPHLETCPSTGRDNTRIEWQLKRWSYNHSNLAIISPSQWLANLASESILKKFPIYHIPNGIDTEIYKPIDPEMCRAALGISNNKKVILFVAHSLQDSRKGSDLLISALQKLPDVLKSEIVLIAMGEGGGALADSSDIQIIPLGYIGGDRLKVIAYAAADISICPTRADNLPLVLQESMACGTPMISFDVGGVPEVVRPGLTGLLAKAENSTDFSEKMIQLLTDKKIQQKMAISCREIAIKEYSTELQASRYINVYQKMLN
ncbi:MAG: glycosyltransferase family 4 protein [Cyanobacteria bacterium J06649_11]